ncbi:MAG: PAS domain S-box protein, partial [Methanomicrobiales archaeon]|nr:PAS domain S-box protein [Methanomicrobiales archaeon]
MISVLYVDDEPGLLEIGKHFLERSGSMIVDTVPSVAEALQYLEAQKYDAIISDYEMPGMDGIGFLQYIRETRPDLPFILFTGRGREDIVIEALNLGADYYLQKGGYPLPQYTELEHKIKLAVQRRKDGRMLAESELRYRRIVETANEGIWAFDAAFVTTYVNQKMADMLGYDAPGMIGHPITDFIPEEDLQDNGQQIVVRRDGVPERHERRFQKSDGTIVWCIISAAPVPDHTGRLAGSFAMLTDITVQKNAERELAARAAQLNVANREMAATLSELRVAEEKLLARNRELEEQRSALATSSTLLSRANHRINLLSSITRHDLITQLS